LPPTFKSVDFGTISSGGSKTESWTPDKDITIHKIMLIERDDKSLSNVDVYISIADVPLTKDFVPGSAIGSDPEYCYQPNMAVSKGSKISITVTNKRADDINLVAVFLYE